MVFVHGGGGDHRIWDNQRAIVGKRYRFIALDQRYFGTAPWPDGGAQFSLRTHVSDLAGFVQALGLGPVYLVGHSYGAVVVLAAAIQHPELARGLFINEPPLTSVLNDPEDEGIIRDWIQEAARIAATAKASDAVGTAKAFYEWVNGQPGGFDALPAETRAVRLQNSRTIALQLSLATRASITCTQLGRIAVPVTISKGELTRPYFQRVADTIQRCIVGSRSVTIPAARHGAPGQAATPFNEALLVFLGAI